MKDLDQNSAVLTRRHFLQRASIAAAGAALPAWFLEEQLGAQPAQTPRSANERPGIALLGCGGMGRGDARSAARFGHITAFCDVDTERLAAAKKDFPNAKEFSDFRKVMEQRDVDVVICGTVDHWHTLVSIAAMRAGKDVYCEKPLTLTIDEGKHLVKAVNDTGRVLQTGSQQRSDARFRLACELVRNGRIGKLVHITTQLPAGPHAGPFAVAPVPDHLNWDLWLGTTPKIDYVPQKCHGSFRYWYQFSGGTMTDWGAHHNDIAQWANGTERGGPTRIKGRPLTEPIPGGYTAASEYAIEYNYANGVNLTCRSVSTDGPDGSHRGKPGALVHGVQFSGTDGWIFVTRGNIEASNPDLLSEPLPTRDQRLYISNDHMGNFFDCVRSRKAPTCDAEIGHRSASVCHLGVIAMRLGREIQWDPDKEQAVRDPEASAMVARPMRAPWSYDAV